MHWKIFDADSPLGAYLELVSKFCSDLCRQLQSDLFREVIVMMEVTLQFHLDALG